MELRNKALNFFFPRLRDILFAATLSASLLLGQRMLNIDSDLGRHLVLGRYILQNHIIPKTDLFSHTLFGTERPPYEWLTQVIFALAYRLAGLDGVILLVGFIIAITFTFIYIQVSKHSNLPITSLFITILAMAASSLHWLPRPHVITFLFLAILLERLESLHNKGHVPLWHFPVLMLIWVNMHGGFVFGFLVWLAYLAGWIWENWGKNIASDKEIWKPLWLGFFLTGIASILTPDGWGSWKAVLSNNSLYVLSHTVETMPPSIYQPGTWPFFILLTVCVILFLVTWNQMQAYHFFLITGMAGAGILIARNIPLFAITAALLLPLWFKKMLNKNSKLHKFEERIIMIQKPLYGVFWPVLVSLGFVLFISGRQIFQKDAIYRFNEQRFPVHASNWLVENPQSGLMLNEFNWGGYLLLQLWPSQRVFIDSQTDFYGESIVREYQQATAASQGWESILAYHNVSWVILSQQTKLTELLIKHINWVIVYEDETAIILRKLP